MTDDGSASEKTTPKLVPVSWLFWFWGNVRKVVVLVVGLTLLAFGVVLMVIPGFPGWPLVLGGLAFLATEFAWAAWLLAHARERLNQVARLAKQQLARKQSTSAASPVSVTEPQSTVTPAEPRSGD